MTREGSFSVPGLAGTASWTCFGANSSRVSAERQPPFLRAAAYKSEQLMLIRPKSISPQKGVKCLLFGNALDDIAACAGICPSCVRYWPDRSRDRFERVHA